MLKKMFNKKEEEKQPETLTIQVAEEIKTKEVPPGVPKPSQKEKDEALPPEEIEKRQKVMLEYTRLSSRYCEPHTKKSRWVTEDDIQLVMSDGRDLAAMCNLPRGEYSGIAALAHSQINNKNPLRFFVLANGMVIINPIITDHTKTPVLKAEACMSHFDKKIKTDVPRYNKITVIYQTLERSENDKIILSNALTEHLSGGQAHVFQHKIGHLNGKGSDIYSDDYTPESCLWLGDGPISEEEFSKLYKINDKIEEAKIIKK